MPPESSHNASGCVDRASLALPIIDGVRGLVLMSQRSGANAVARLRTVGELRGASADHHLSSGSEDQRLPTGCLGTLAAAHPCVRHVGIHALSRATAQAARPSAWF
jgi:hypothetical protein